MAKIKQSVAPTQVAPICTPSGYVDLLLWLDDIPAYAHVIQDLADRYLLVSTQSVVGQSQDKEDGILMDASDPLRPGDPVRVDRGVLWLRYTLEGWKHEHEDREGWCHHAQKAGLLNTYDILLGSSPGDDRIEQEDQEAANRSRYIVPCPRCRRTDGRDYSPFAKWLATPENLQRLLDWVKDEPCSRCAVQIRKRNKSEKGPGNESA